MDTQLIIALILIPVWCIGLAGIYTRGTLDALAWSKRLLESNIDDLKVAAPDMPIDWPRVLYYAGPLVVFTGVTIWNVAKIC